MAIECSSLWSTRKRSYGSGLQNFQIEMFFWSMVSFIQCYFRYHENFPLEQHISDYTCHILPLNLLTENFSNSLLCLKSSWKKVTHTFVTKRRLWEEKIAFRFKTSPIPRITLEIVFFSFICFKHLPHSCRSKSRLLQSHLCWK